MVNRHEKLIKRFNNGKNKLIPIGNDVRVVRVEIITDAVERNLSAGTIDAIGTAILIPFIDYRIGNAV